jgi:hypothetical protein
MRNIRTKTAKGYLKIAKRIKDDIKAGKKDREEATKLISRIEELLEGEKSDK